MVLIYLLQIILRIPLDQKIFLGIGIFKQERNYEFYLILFHFKVRNAAWNTSEKITRQVIFAIAKRSKTRFMTHGLYLIAVTNAVKKSSLVHINV